MCHKGVSWASKGCYKGVLNGAKCHIRNDMSRVTSKELQVKSEKSGVTTQEWHVKSD